MSTMIGFIGIAILFLFIFLGMRIAYAVTLVGIVGIYLIKGWGPATSFLGAMPTSIVGTYAFSAIPLFVLMGYFAFYSNVTEDLFETTRRWVQHIRGGLPIATILASAGFAAVSGISLASSSILGKMTIPPMLRNGVDRRLAAGVVALGGCLAALIPPSGIMIIFGILTEQSIASLFIAGIIPGALTVLAYLFYIYVRALINPAIAPVSPAYPWRSRFRSLSKSSGIAALAVMVIGGIYLGVFTPTEAAGVGAFGAFVMALVLKRFTFRKFRESLLETVKTTAMVFAILVGINVFIRFLALSGLTQMINEFVLSLDIPAIFVLIVMLIIYFILGMLMDAVSMMMLTLPIFFPVIMALGIHPIWFGIFVVKMTEIGMVTPPVGLNCFVLKSAAPDIPISDIFRGCIPFIIIELFLIAMMMAFPQIVTFLPDMMNAGS